MSPREHERRLAQLGQAALELICNDALAPSWTRDVLAAKARTLELTEQGLWGLVPTQPDLPAPEGK